MFSCLKGGRMMESIKKEPLVRVEHLKKYFNTAKGILHAVDDISFEVFPGETLGLVGESGCGKSTVGNVMMRFHMKTSGNVFFCDTEIFTKDKTIQSDLCKKMQIIFQDPYSSLNPKQTIKTILSEAYEIHKIAKGEKLDELLRKLCIETGIDEDLWNHYPHELDGGKRQIVGIARALSLDPEFIICDEPVSSLDVSVQAKIINLLMDLQKKKNLSFLFISHDLSVVRHISDRIAVMYLGQIVEIADKKTIFRNTLHPYSIALLSAVPKVDVDNKVSRIVLTGDVPSPVNPKPGCRFAPRCWMAQEKCFSESPELTEVETGHCVACHFWKQSRELSLSAEHMSLKTDLI